MASFILNFSYFICDIKGAFVKGLGGFLVGGSSQFRRNFSQLASSNLVAQFIGFISLPVLSRIYTPSDFGSLASFTAIYSIVLSVSALRLDWMIPRTRSLTIARLLQQAGLLVVVGVTLISLLATVGWSVLIGNSISINSTWLPLSILAGGAFLIFQSGCVWQGTLSDVGGARLGQAVVVVAVSLSMGLLWRIESGLIIGYVAGLLAALIFIARKRISILSIDVRSIFLVISKILKRRLNEISSQVGLAIINIGMTSSPFLLMTAFFNSKDLGEYSVAFRVAVAPVSIITGAVAYSFVADAAGMMKGRELEIRKFYLGTIRRLAVLASGALVAIVLTSYALPWILGNKEWAASGSYMTAVTPYLFGIIVFSPTTHLFLYGKARLQAIIDMITLLAVVISFVFAKIIWGSPVAAVWLGSFVILAGYIARHKAHLAAMAGLGRCYGHG